MPPKPPILGRAEAEALAFHAVAFIVADEELLPRFLALTGSDGGDLRERLGDAHFLGAVLDFVLEDDRTVRDVADAAGVTPETVPLARSKLPGAHTDWSP